LAGLLSPVFMGELLLRSCIRYLRTISF